MEWTDPLKSQQNEFIERLQAGAENLLRCQLSGIHGEIKAISSSNLKQLREYCWVMAEKYKKEHPRQVFINHMKGKLGEEVVKECLANLVDKVNYQILPSGDGKVDLVLDSSASIGIQVKTRCSNIDKVYWSISPDELQKNKVIACVLIPEKQKDFDEFRSEYYPIMVGFLPTEIIRKQISEDSLSWEESNGNKSVKLKIHDLLYSGGLRSYLEKLNLLTLDEINLIRLKSEGWEILSTFEHPSVRCLDIDRNGEIFASGGEDHMIRIWDLKTGKCILSHTRRYHNYKTGDVDYLMFSSDAKFIISKGFVSGSKSLQDVEQRKIQILNWETDEVTSFIAAKNKESNSVIAVSPNSNVLAYDTNEKIQLYNFCDREYINILEGHRKGVSSITFSSDGRLASGSRDGQVRIWKWKTGEFADFDFEHSTKVNAVAISPNNQVLASGSDDGKIALFNLATKKVYSHLTEHLDSVKAINFSPDSLILASGSKDDTIKLWYVKTGELIGTIKANTIAVRGWEEGVYSLVFSPDGQLLLAGLGVGEIKIWRRV